MSTVVDAEDLLPCLAAEEEAHNVVLEAMEGKDPLPGSKPKTRSTKMANANNSKTSSKSNSVGPTKWPKGNP